VQRFLHLVELERLNDRFDLFHLVHARQAAGVLLKVFVRIARSRASQWADASSLARTVPARKQVATPGCSNIKKNKIIALPIRQRDLHIN
jgi:hypothetical protein